MLRRFLLCCGVLVLGMACIPASATAQSPPVQTGLQVNPAIVELLVNPGELHVRSLYIRNIVGEPMPVAISFDRLKPTEEELEVTDTTRFDASSWLSVGAEHHILEPGEQREIVLQAKIPPDAEPGGHYATIFLDPVLPPTHVGQSGAQVAGRIGVLVFITVSGEAHHNLSVQQPATSFLQTRSGVPLSIGIENHGSVHEIPTAKVLVKNIFGAVKAELPLSPRIVLPNTRKTYSPVWDGAGWFGVYSVEVSGTYSQYNNLASSKRYFMVIQWLPAILLLFVVPLVVIFVQRTHRRWPAAYRAFMAEAVRNKKR